jgi:hypothetical protein
MRAKFFAKVFFVILFSGLAGLTVRPIASLATRQLHAKAVTQPHPATDTSSVRVVPGPAAPGVWHAGWTDVVVSNDKPGSVVVAGTWRIAAPSPITEDWVIGIAVFEVDTKTYQPSRLVYHQEHDRVTVRAGASSLAEVYIDRASQLQPGLYRAELYAGQTGGNPPLDGFGLPAMRLSSWRGVTVT